MEHRNTQSGNVLFIILLAVSLFAALSYAVTDSSRGDANIDKEQEQLTLGAIENYQALLNAAATRLTSLYDCDTISYAAPGSTAYTSASTEEKRCFMYAPEGGDVYYKDLDGTIPPDCEALTIGGTCNFYSGLAVVYAGSTSGGKRLYVPPTNESSSDWNTAQSTCAAYGTGWRAPSVSEYPIFHANQNIGDLNGTFPTSEYLTNWGNGIYTHGYRWATNDYYSTRLKTAAGPVRCVRRVD